MTDNNKRVSSASSFQTTRHLPNMSIPLVPIANREYVVLPTARAVQHPIRSDSIIPAPRGLVAPESTLHETQAPPHRRLADRLYITQAHKAGTRPDVRQLEAAAYARGYAAGLRKGSASRTSSTTNSDWDLSGAYGKREDQRRMTQVYRDTAKSRITKAEMLDRLLSRLRGSGDEESRTLLKGFEREMREVASKREWEETFGRMKDDGRGGDGVSGEVENMKEKKKAWYRWLSEGWVLF